MGLWLTQKTCSGPSDIVLAAGVSATVSTSLLDCAIFTNARMIGKACFQKTNVFVLTDATAFISAVHCPGMSNYQGVTVASSY